MKKLLVSVSLILVMLSICAVGYAEGATADLKGQISGTTVKPGGEITIIATIDNIKGVQRGFNALSGKLEYDNNVFEELKAEQFQMQNDWEQMVYNPNNKMFVTERAEGLKTGGDVFKVTLKAKRNAKEGEYTIRLKEFMVSEGIGDVELSTVEVQVKVEGKQISSNVTQQENQNTIYAIWIILAILGIAIIILLVAYYVRKNKNKNNVKD